jgi:hypothetical protein
VALVGENVVTRLPEDPTFPLLRIQRIGGRQAVAVPMWLDGARIQVDVWADTKKQARDAAATAEAVLMDAPNHAYDLGVITAVEELIGLRFAEDPDSNDPSSGHPRPRYQCDLRVYTRPPD